MPLLQSLAIGCDTNDLSPVEVCAEIASIFSVRPTEVGLLQLRDRALTFLFPVELRAVGSIPLSSSAIAARTAQNRTAEIFNRFAEVKHHTLFERIKLGGNEDNQTIQKLMSSPVVDSNQRVLGVLQISRKGISLSGCGPDFTNADLRTLESVAAEISPLLPKMLLKGSAKRELKFVR